MIVKEKLVEARKAAKLTQAQVAERAGVPQSLVSDLETGRRKKTDSLPEIATALGVPVATLDPRFDPWPDGSEQIGMAAHRLLREMAPDTHPTVPLVGVVGAGAAMLLFEYGQHDPGERVAAPEGATDKTVAAEIRGASLGELFDRWIVYYDEIRDPPTYDLVNKLCVLGLADGRVVIKKLRRGSAPGLWTLLSNNDKPIEDVAVLWAAKVKQMSPR